MIMPSAPDPVPVSEKVPSLFVERASVRGISADSAVPPSLSVKPLGTRILVAVADDAVCTAEPSRGDSVRR